MRILTRTQTEAIYEIIHDLKTKCDTLKKENEELRKSVTRKDEAIDSLNEKLYHRNCEIFSLRDKLNANGLTWTKSGIDFPATTKPEDKTI